MILFWKLLLVEWKKNETNKNLLCQQSFNLVDQNGNVIFNLINNAFLFKSDYSLSKAGHIFFLLGQDMNPPTQFAREHDCNIASL